MIDGKYSEGVKAHLCCLYLCYVYNFLSGSSPFIVSTHCAELGALCHPTPQAEGVFILMTTLGCDWYDFVDRVLSLLRLTSELVWPLAMMVSSRSPFPSDSCLECSLQWAAWAPDLQLSPLQLLHTHWDRGVGAVGSGRIVCRGAELP